MKKNHERRNEDREMDVKVKRRVPARRVASWGQREVDSNLTKRSFSSHLLVLRHFPIIDK